jgi:tetratricopeptide (TPR) repeat protein
MSDERKHLSDLFGVVQFDPANSDAAPSWLTKKGKSAEDSKKLGNAALEAGNSKLALEHFERAVSQSKGSSSARVDLAIALEMADREEESRSLLSEVIESDTDCAEARVALAEIHRRSAEFQLAIDQLERAIATEPSNSNYHFKLAEVCRDAKLFSAAISAAERAAIVDPTISFYHFWLADLLLELGKFTEALEPLKAAHDLSPGDDYILMKSAVAFWGANQKPQALKAIRLASELDPDRKMYLALEAWFQGQGTTHDSKAIELDRYESDELDRIISTL